MIPDATPGPEMPAQALGRQWAPARFELNLPNAITLARLIAVPITIWLILDERYGSAFWLFVAAGISDALDGYIAKRFDLRTRLGAVLDPVADKALLAGVYLSLGWSGMLPAGLVILVVLRDALIVAGYLLVQRSAEPAQTQPLYISKINTAVQIALIGFVLARLGLGADGGSATGIMIALAAITTVWSGFAYLLRWARLLAATGRRL